MDTNNAPTVDNSRLPVSNSSLPFTKKAVDISSALSSALAEEKERSKHQLNLILRNLLQVKIHMQAQKDQDTKKATEIFKHIGLKTAVNNAIC